MAFFLMRCFHQQGADERRDAERARHREWVGSGGGGRVCVLIGSAFLDGEGRVAGNFGILEAGNLSTAREFAEGDPFAVAGIVHRIEITPLPDNFQVGRIGEPMSPRLPRAA